MGRPEHRMPQSKAFIPGTVESRGLGVSREMTRSYSWFKKINPEGNDMETEGAVNRLGQMAAYAMAMAPGMTLSRRGEGKWEKRGSLEVILAGLLFDDKLDQVPGEDILLPGNYIKQMIAQRLCKRMVITALFVKSQNLQTIQMFNRSMN